MEQEFINSITDKKIWTDACPVHHSRLMVIEIRYKDFSGNTQKGQMMVLDVIAKKVLQIFAKLYLMDFRINKISLIDNYAGSDDASMEDNNSSAFNCRKIAGTEKFSLHSYGTAIDINPVQNPIIYYENELQNIEPKTGVDYLDRSYIRVGMIDSDVVELFKSYCFEWGGDWKDPVDYHHFQLPRKISEYLASLPYEEGFKYFTELCGDTSEM